VLQQLIPKRKDDRKGLKAWVIPHAISSFSINCGMWDQALSAPRGQVPSIFEYMRLGFQRILPSESHSKIAHGRFLVSVGHCDWGAQQTTVCSKPNAQAVLSRNLSACASIRLGLSLSFHSLPFSRSSVRQRMTRETRAECSCFNLQPSFVSFLSLAAGSMSHSQGESNNSYSFFLVDELSLTVLWMELTLRPSLAHTHIRVGRQCVPESKTETRDG